MKSDKMPVKVGLLFGLSVIMILLLERQAKAQSAASSPLGGYGSPSTYCGSKPVPQNVATVPWIGCFYLSAGHSAGSTFSNHQVDVAVDVAGQEVFTVDGTLVREVTGPQRPASGTNLPFVHVGGAAGFSFCEDDTSAACPSTITVFSRNPDKSVLFMVLECFPPANHVCVTTQENWDFEKSRGR